MKTRHKPPSLVSMWMLDVFCCALGCVTLLWLLSTREAKLEIARNAEALKNIARTEAERDTAEQSRRELIGLLEATEEARTKLQTELDLLQGRYLALTRERDELAKQFSLSQEQARQAATELATARELQNSKEADNKQMRVQLAKMEEELAKKLQAVEAAELDLRKAATSATELNLLLRTRTQERDDFAARLKTSEDKLIQADARLQAMNAEANQTAADSLSAMKKTNQELSEAKAMIIDLMGQKAKLADKIDEFKRDSDNRFAGISLTGKRVVFVVDISGSMKLQDDKTPAPEKWPLVVETVVKVMRSLPDLELFQVVLFSRSADYLSLPGGSGAAWHPYRGQATLREVADALNAVNPQGDTNLYKGFELAFKLKPGGLDTIYLFSDGLPTSGPGIPTEELRTLTATQRTDRLGKHLLSTLNNVWNPRIPGREDRRVKINSIGFYFESPEIGAFLWALSRDHDGNFVGLSKP